MRRTSLTSRPPSEPDRAASRWRHSRAPHPRNSGARGCLRFASALPTICRVHPVQSFIHRTVDQALLRLAHIDGRVLHAKYELGRQTRAAPESGGDGLVHVDSNAAAKRYGGEEIEIS